MAMTRVLLSVVVGFILAGCSSSVPYRVVQVPEHGADLYPLSQTRAGITIAIDEIRSPARVQRHFGADLIKEGILPVNVVVSNYGQARVMVKPSDLLLYRGRDVIDALPIEMVSTAAKRQHGSLHAKTEQEIDRFFDSATFKEALLAPGETYRGVMFFAAPTPAAKDERFFTMLSAHLDGGPRLRVGLTNLETGERVLFGPFSLSLPGNAWSAFSYTSY
jgi:hypothetical protein